jgi:HSP90 family molecular chaperone
MHGGVAVYCLQELVANAVDATRRTGCERRITIGLHHNKGTTDPGKRYAMTIHDNGRGMSEKDLDQCVTYALSQDARGLNTERLFKTKDSPKFVDSEISRFGVGMLDAAFAAGESVYVMTKRRQAVEVQQVAIELDKVPFSSLIRRILGLAP